MADPIVLPDDVQLDGVAPPTVPGVATPQPTVLPDHVQLDGRAPEGVVVNATRPPESTADDLGDMAENAATGVARIPGAVVGVPHMLAHTADWFLAHVGNTLGISKDATGADVDKYNPLAMATPSSGDVDDAVFKGASALAGRPVHPYEPTTMWGKLGQAAITGAGAGLVDPLAVMGAMKAGTPIAEALSGAVPRMANTAVAASAANGADQIDPGNPVLPALAALFAHTAAGVVPRVATAAGRSAVSDLAAPLWDPKGAAEAKLGHDLAPVDNMLPGVAAPSAADLSNAEGAVKAADNGIGSGVDPNNSMQFLRDHLSGLKDNLKSARSAISGPMFDQVRAQPGLPMEDVAQLRTSVDPATFATAEESAATDMRNLGKAPYYDVDGKPLSQRGGDDSSYSPDLAMRIKTKLNENANKANIDAEGQQRTAGLTGAASTVSDTLKTRYPNTYPAALDAHAAASMPLSPFYKAPVARALAEQKDPATGRSLGYVQNNADLFSQLAGSKDPGSVVGAFVDAAGDKKTVSNPIEDAVISQLRSKGAIGNTGEVDPTIFDREIKPYAKTLSMYSPNLMQKFGTAQAATASLGKLRAQSSLLDGVGEGAMRDTKDTSGIVTQGSFDRWLTANRQTLSDNQDKGAVMRLQQIRNALPRSPLTSAESMEDLIPQALGAYFDGSEGAVNAHLMPRLMNATVGARVRQFGNFYSQAIERAIRDPAYAKTLTARMANKPIGLSDTKALLSGIWSDFKQTGRLAPSAVLAGAPDVAP